MAPNSIVVKAELQISDMDRHYYAAHPLTVAQHPSETEERLMVRLVAFILYADERLEFGRGLSDESEPDLWQRDYIGDVERWIDLGQPDESRIRKACGKAREVVIVNYSGRSADIWWEKNAVSLSRSKNLQVIDLDVDTVAALTAMFNRTMRLDCQIDNEEVTISNEETSVSFTPRVRKALTN